MKTFKKTLMSAFAIVAVASGMVSCQQDDDDLYLPQEPDTAKQQFTASSYSYTPNNLAFNYGNFGTTNADQYVQDCNFSLRKNAVSSEIAISDLLEMVATKVATAAGGKIGGMIWELISDGGKASQDHSAEILEGLSGLQEQMKGINSMIQQLEEKCDQMEATAIYRKRMEDYLYLNVVNLRAYTDFYGYLSKGDSVKAFSALEDWAEKSDLGINGPTSTYVYMNMLAQKDNSQGMNMAQIYDYWVFQTTPWEHQGYQKREQLRAADLGVAMTGYLLAQAYYSRVDKPSSQTMIDIMNESFRIMKDYYDKYGKVEHHDDKIVCQIKDAHIVFDKSVTKHDLTNFPWYNPIKEWHFSNSDLNKLMFGPVRPENQMTSDEATNIFNYYNSNPDSIYTFKDILDDAGFEPDVAYATNVPNVMILYTGANYKSDGKTFERNYDFYYNKAMMMNESKSPIRDDFRVGRMWIEQKGIPLIDPFYVLRAWVEGITPANYQFYSTHIQKRYSDMKPF